MSGSDDRRENWLESLALSASMLCLAHCLALPLALAALPALSEILDIPESFHLWMLALVIPTSGAALVAGRMRHGVQWPLLVGIVGLALLTVGAMLFGSTSVEMPSTVAGSLLLAIAHVGNWKLRRALHVAH